MKQTPFIKVDKEIKQSPAPDVSVIVVTYNQEGTIARTLDSILSQKFEGSFEIVIGDDCSSDATEDICRRYATKYPDIIRYFRREKNMGVCRNYFDCIEQSRGRYLADCAGDDFWVDNNKLSIEFAELEADAEVSLVATDFLACEKTGGNLHRYDGGSRIVERKVYEKGQLLDSFLANNQIIHLCTAMYRRDMLLELVNKDRDIYISPDFVCEDLQILMAMLSSGKVVMLPRITLHYTVGSESISHSRSYSRQYAYEEAALRQQFLLERHFRINEKLVAGRWEMRLRYLASLAWKSGERRLRKRFLDFVSTLPYRRGFKLKVYKLLMRVC